MCVISFALWHARSREIGTYRKDEESIEDLPLSYG